MFYNNYKWNITFNNCGSLYCIPVTYIIEYTTAFQLKKKKTQRWLYFLIGS